MRRLLQGIALLLALLAAVPAGQASDPREGHRLRFTQSNRAPLLRSHYALLIRPVDRPGALAVLLLEWPARFDGRLWLDTVRLCRMAAPPQTSRTRCVEPLPARVERVGPGVLRVVPERPLAGEVVHGLMLLAFNPSAAGTYPVRLRAVLAADPNAGFVTLGLWPILIESEED